MKKLILSVIVLCLLSTNILFVSANRKDDNAIQTIKQFIKAQNNHDWQSYVSLQIKGNQEESQEFISDNQNIKNCVGIFNVLSAKIKDIKLIGITKEANSQVETYIVGIDYMVKTEDKYFYNL